MRKIEVTAKTSEQAKEKGLQMLGVDEGQIVMNIITEGSMLKKAVVEICVFENAEEKEEYLKEKPTAKKVVKLVKSSEIVETADVDMDSCENEIKTAVAFLSELCKIEEVDAEIKPTIRDGGIVIAINGEGASKLIGFHGENLESVQFLMNTILKNAYPEFRKKIYLDIENYRRKRQENVSQMAERLALKVISNKRSIKLEPMNSYERKSIHSCLQGVEHIGTHSEGEEPNRRLVIDYVE